MNNAMNPCSVDKELQHAQIKALSFLLGGPSSFLLNVRPRYGTLAQSQKRINEALSNAPLEWRGQHLISRLLEQKNLKI